MTTFPQQLKLNVTSNDINIGRKQDCRRCPVTRAAKRALGKEIYKLYEVRTCPCNVNVWSGYMIVAQYELGYVERDFIGNFDSSRLVEPFKGTINKITDFGT